MDKFRKRIKHIKDIITKPFRSLFGRNRHPEEEQQFIDLWTDIFTSDADVFTGLYASIEKVSDGTANRPARVFKEWYDRTRYKWENSPEYEVTESFLDTLKDEETEETDYQKWANLLLEAAGSACITKDEEKHITLDESSTDAYIELDGGELSEDDNIEIISSAWYQNVKLLEQGYCRKVSPDDLDGKEDNDEY